MSSNEQYRQYNNRLKKEIKSLKDENSQLKHKIGDYQKRLLRTTQPPTTIKEDKNCFIKTMLGLAIGLFMGMAIIYLLTLII
jgi:predicted RNase H-like nuclease (RuvC/YqgF family)